MKRYAVCYLVNENYVSPEQPGRRGEWTSPEDVEFVMPRRAWLAAEYRRTNRSPGTVRLRRIN